MKSRAALLLLLLVVLLTLSSCAKKPAAVKQASPPPEVALPAPPPPSEPSKLEGWRLLVLEQRSAPIQEKLQSVNTFFNRFEFIEDRYLWGRDDYWATLDETLSKSGGDCEDFTIAKYFTLRSLDIADRQLRITYVISLQTKKPHMVLTYSPESDADPLVLDTVNQEILPVSRRSDLIPVYSFNEVGYWLARKEKGWDGKLLGSPARLSQWWGLLQRAVPYREGQPGG